MSKAFGDWVIRLRAEKKWNQSELAQAMNRSRADVGRVENAEREPTKAWCVDFANAIGLPLKTVLGMAGHVNADEVEEEGQPIKSATRRKVDALLSMLNAEDQEEAIKLLETFADNRRKRATTSAKKAAA